MKIKKGDTVQILSGNDRGRQGEVIRAMPKSGKIVVRGVNVMKKNQKKSQRNLRSQQTGIIEVEVPIDVSNAILVTPSGKPTRVNYRFEGDSKKRFSNKHDEVIG
ncbi:MAG: 50S ribosomal protein L24 [Chloroflexota bacterium]|jgi:large subunit ribosomal protein L24|nr:50S ribosomal protein L24 [Chloroflexota bacterium]